MLGFRQSDRYAPMQTYLFFDSKFRLVFGAQFVLNRIKARVVYCFEIRDLFLQLGYLRLGLDTVDDYRRDGFAPIACNAF